MAGGNQKHEMWQWYLAQMIQVLTSQGDPGNTVWVNWILIEAMSAEDAYWKAMAEGTYYNYNSRYKGNMQWSRFRGLEELSLIGPELIHGTVICCEPMNPRTEEEISAMLFPKEQMALFEPRLISGEIRSPYIPEGAEWYLAFLLFQLRTQKAESKLGQILALVHANSPDDAFQIAPQVGQELEQTRLFTEEYEFIFRGVRNLDVIHDNLEHGEEITYEEYEDLSEAEIRDRICKKDDLAVFGGKSLCACI